jgi:hypothetical protein
MDAEPAKDYLFKKTLALDPEQFEQLCKMMLARLEKTENTELTPFRKDGGIDVRARIDRDLFYADLGVQAKRYAPSNTIGSSGMQKFSGALGSQDFNVGAFITTSTFTKPAEKESNQAFMPIKLINGPDLMGILIQNEIGIGKEEPGAIKARLNFSPGYLLTVLIRTATQRHCYLDRHCTLVETLTSREYSSHYLHIGLTKGLYRTRRSARLPPPKRWALRSCRASQFHR